MEEGWRRFGGPKPHKSIFKILAHESRHFYARRGRRWRSIFCVLLDSTKCDSPPSTLTVIRHYLFYGIAFCALMPSCHGVEESNQSQEVHALESSKFIGVRLNTYTDTTAGLVVFSDQALVDEESSRSMVFTGSRITKLIWGVRGRNQLKL